MTTDPAGWYVDPTGRHTYRYWDGRAWSNQVSNGGSTAVDPITPDDAAAAIPPAPGSKAANPPVAVPPAEPPPVIQVSQRGGSGFGAGTIVGILVGILVVALIVIALVNNSGDDGSPPATNAPPTTVADSG